MTAPDQSSLNQGKRPFPAVSKDDIPFLTTEQMIEVDRAMIEDYGIALIQMMENAGRNLADVARRIFLGGAPAGRPVAVLAGPGGNGGGALVCARRLANWGAEVRVHLATESARMTEVPGHQLAILRAMGVEVVGADVLGEAGALIVDGVIGYSLRGDPRGGARTLVDWANRMTAPVLSLDVPSGIDTTTGRVASPAIRATATMTLALPKEGLRASGVRPLVGDLYLADISVPPELYASERLGLDVGPIFSAGDVVRVLDPEEVLLQA